MDYRAWAGRVAHLAAAVAKLQELEADLGLASSGSSAWHAGLTQKLLPQLAADPFLIVAIAGGTNTGKSTVFNHLAGCRASRVHPNATQTKHPVCLLPRGFLARHDLGRIFPEFQLRRWSSEEDARREGPENLLIYREDPSGTQPPNLLLLDTPDIDGALPVNWRRAGLICHAADVLVAVLTEEKYNDFAVRRFFGEAAGADKTILLVFNKITWPADRAYCDGWQATFCAGTGAAPLHAYATPRDRAAADENRLPFHPLSAHATGPRRDLADLQFDAIKIRSFRGTLRQVLDARQGLPAFLSAVAARAAEYRAARQIIQDGIRIQLNAPHLPNHVVMDEIWRWLDPQRMVWERTIHRAYARFGQLLFSLRPGHRSPAEREADFIRAEGEMLSRALEEVFRRLELVHRGANPILQQELGAVLKGRERQKAFDDLRGRHGQMTLLTDSYRRFVADRLNGFARENPVLVKTIKWGLVATAIIRPAITLGFFGVGQLTAHAGLHLGAEAVGQAAAQAGAQVAQQAVAHSAYQVAGEVAAGAVVAVGGEGAMAGLTTKARELVATLFAEFYRERATLLGQVVHDCSLGQHLERIDRLSRVVEEPAFAQATALAADLARELTAPAGRADVPTEPVTVPA